MAEIIHDHPQENEIKRRIKCYLYDEPHIIPDQVEEFFKKYEELRLEFTEKD